MKLSKYDLMYKLSFDDTQSEEDEEDIDGVDETEIDPYKPFAADEESKDQNELDSSDDDYGTQKQKRERKLRPHHEIITPTVDKFLELLAKKNECESQLHDIEVQLDGVNEILQRNDAERHPSISRNKAAKTWLQEHAFKKKKKKPTVEAKYVIDELHKIAEASDNDQAKSLIKEAIESIAKNNNEDFYSKRNLYNVRTLEEEKDKEYPKIELSSRSLSTRHCPDHYGIQMVRIGEGSFQCELDGKVYNWNVGFTDYSGNKFPGGGVASIDFPNMVERPFETREIATKKRVS